ncbi:class I SAM-dependent methyltransferase [Algibacter luteus]|uniref:class I SAM-dependent methyltransferase n=1 Tax=Algibacter luteus TaxID=1178825 RepID=UPI002591EE99|nr:class I SAM-dependent methyltransferase [Algibacter luteus]WJJ95504.1 class I SAM-dependent methyltransferase [Algibacter luteus]
MRPNLNKDLYSSKLLKAWSENYGLLPIEKYFIKKYLVNKAAKVIEAGTGGGRIIFEIEKLGYKDLYAFDYVDKMIAICNEKKFHSNSTIQFNTADATNLDVYKDNQFDYLVYLQQILCFLDRDTLHLGLKEAHRIGNANAVYLFSFLNWDSKWYNPILSAIVNFSRVFKNNKISKNELPWLKINNKFNWRFLNKNQPLNLWLKEKEIVEILENNGFSIIEIKTKVNGEDKVGHIHIACKRNEIESTKVF